MVEASKGWLSHHILYPLHQGHDKSTCSLNKEKYYCFGHIFESVVFLAIAHSWVLSDPFFSTGKERHLVRKQDVLFLLSANICIWIWQTTKEFLTLYRQMQNCIHLISDEKYTGIFLLHWRLIVYIEGTPHRLGQTCIMYMFTRSCTFTLDL